MVVMYLNKNGLSRVIAVVAAVVIVVGTASAYFFVLQPGAPAQQQAAPAPAPAPAPQPQQPAPAPAPAVDPAKADALQKAVESHFAKFAAKDVPGQLADYTQVGTYAEWKGQAGAFTGKYDGYPRIRILYATIAGNTETLKTTLQNYKADIAGDTATVTMKVLGEGRGKLIGAFNMDVDVKQKWVYQDGKWLIQNDSWDFKLLKTEIVAEGTVFPIHWKKLGDFSAWNDRIKSLFGT